MYFLILLGVVASVLKFMRFEPVVDWSLHPLRMVFLFLLLWSVWQAFAEIVKKQIAQRVNKKFTNLNHPKQSKAHALENIPELL